MTEEPDAKRASSCGGDRGASLVEYALLVSLIAVVCIAAVIVLGENVSESFDSSGGSLFSD